MLCRGNIFGLRLQTIHKNFKAFSSKSKMTQAQGEPGSSLINSIGSYPEKMSYDNVTVWSEMKDLAVKYNCLSLGEGATNVMPPMFLINAMTQAMMDGHNQYNRQFGVIPLVNKIAERYGTKLGK